ncbi:MAG: hypothetical protein AAF307_13960 [Pseudomonadota bacterium]
MKSFSVALFAALSASAALAATTGEEDGIVINRINSTDFEVIQGTNFGAAEFWCGAATFIERRSGLSELTPIYVKRGSGPATTAAGQRGVVFSTSNAGLPPSPQRLTLTVDVPGTMVKSVTARRYCRDAFTRSTK